MMIPITRPQLPPYLTAALLKAALRYAGLLQPGEEIEGIVRYPDRAEITITVRTIQPISTQSVQ